jgi:hypothetical protein
MATMANAYSGDAGSELTPHQQSQLNQLAASIGYGSQLIFSTEEKGVVKHVDASSVKDEGEPDRTETLTEQQRRVRRTRPGREDNSIPSQNEGQTLDEKKNETETKKQSTGTANYKGATSASQSPVPRASHITENHNQFKSSPESNTEEEEWEYRKSRRIIGRHLRRMAQQEQVALLEESQKKARTRGPGKAVRAKKAKSTEPVKIKKKRKPYTKKLKDPPKEQGSVPAATGSGKQDATVQQEPAQAPKKLDESTKNDESKAREDDSVKGKGRLCLEVIVIETTLLRGKVGNV